MCFTVLLVLFSLPFGRHDKTFGPLCILNSQDILLKKNLKFIFVTRFYVMSGNLLFIQFILELFSKATYP